MKSAILCFVMAAGTLFAADQSKSDMPKHISGDDQLALATSSPRVHMKRKDNKKADRVVADKTTINAFVPVGK